MGLSHLMVKASPVRAQVFVPNQVFCVSAYTAAILSLVVVETKILYGRSYDPLGHVAVGSPEIGPILMHGSRRK
jgi:hypothetical protein